MTTDPTARHALAPLPQLLQGPVIAMSRDLLSTREAILIRARNTGATTAARARATRAALAELQAGHSVATAIAVAMRHLPSQRALRAVQ